MSASAVIPALVDRLVAAGLEDPCVLLPRSGDSYMHQDWGTAKVWRFPLEICLLGKHPMQVSELGCLGSVGVMFCTVGNATDSWWKPSTKATSRLSMRR